MNQSGRNGNGGLPSSLVQYTGILFTIFFLGIILVAPETVHAQTTSAPSLTIKTSSLTFNVDDAPGTTQFVELDATATFVGKNVGVKNLGTIWTKDQNEWKHRKAIVTVNPPARISQGFVSIPLVPPSTVRQAVTVPMKIPIRRKDLGTTAGTGSVRIAIYFFQNQPAIFDIPITLTAGASQVTPSGTTGTTSGSQALSSCPVGFADCDNKPENGCEADLNREENCGSCTNRCVHGSPTPRCRAGKCRMQCTGGMEDCDGIASNGCETTLTVDKCYGCAPCSTINNNPSCSGGRCELSCFQGFSNCDGNTDNGCESNLKSDLTCGSCTNTCKSDATCSTVEGKSVCTATTAGPPAPEITIPGLIGYFPFDTDTKDVITQTVGKAPLFRKTNGVYGQAAHFDSTYSIDLGTYPPLRQTSALTYSVWFNRPSNGKGSIIGSGPLNGYGLGNLRISGRGVTFYWNSAGTFDTWYVQSTLPDNENTWTHLAIAIDFNAKKANFYFDGKPAPVQVTAPEVWKPNPPSEPWMNLIGGHGSQYFLGVLDELRIYNRILNEQEIAILAQAPAGATLTTKQFASTCAPGFGDCDNNPANGCETDTTKLPNCGVCGRTCNLPGVTPNCNNGKCEFACNPGHGNCDFDASNGCETNLRTLDNCHSCGDKCVGSTNTIASCDTGTCVTTPCPANFGDCDKKPENGCETDLFKDSRCGSCELTCHFSQSCVQGAGYCKCNPNLGNCDGQSSNGCETTITSNTHCGSCGNVCNAGTSCQLVSGNYMCWSSTSTPITTTPFTPPPTSSWVYTANSCVYITEPKYCFGRTYPAGSTFFWNWQGLNWFLTCLDRSVGTCRDGRTLVCRGAPCCPNNMCSRIIGVQEG